MSSFKNISIRNKLILIQAVTALVALLICCSIFVLNGIHSFKQSSERKMYSIVRIISANAVSPLQFMDQDAATNLLGKLSSEPDVREAVLLDRSGKLFASYTNPRGETPRKTLLTGAYADGRYLSQYTGARLVVNYKIMEGGGLLGTIIIESELTDLKQMVKNSLIAAGVVLVASLISGLVISLFLQRTISSRLQALVNKTREVAETGNYTMRVHNEANDEIGILSTEFNRLLEQIDNMERSLREANQELERRVQQRTAELESANKELESFSYTVSHDLKAPLRAINGFTDILVKKYASAIDDKGKDIAGVIVANAKKMGQLIEDLLQFSRIGRKEMAIDNFSMDELVNQVLADVQAQHEGRNVTVEKDTLPPARGDRNLLAQVWTNLVSNAFKYTMHKDAAVIKIGCYQRGDEVEYFITDNGAGFDMRYADKLFRVFQRLHGSDEFEGTGVGLAIVSRIVSRHGGRIWASGKVNEGAEFHFTLPAKPFEPLQSVPEAPPEISRVGA